MRFGHASLELQPPHSTGLMDLDTEEVVVKIPQTHSPGLHTMLFKRKGLLSINYLRILTRLCDNKHNCHYQT